jgi:predicted metal-binding membrane protein
VPVYLASVWLGATGAELVPYGVALVLIAAGTCQLSPLKQVCLRACRSPLGFLLGRWRAGPAGSLVLGMAHALYCVGCCWALMVVLVAAGAMGLSWVLLIASLVSAEKLLPGGVPRPHARLRDRLGHHVGPQQRTLRPVCVELRLATPQLRCSVTV